MKKLLLLTSLCLGVALTGLARTEDAPVTVSLPAAPAPAPATAADTAPASASEGKPAKSGHKAHSRNHHKKGGKKAPAGEASTPQS